jgi:hypothetical protein
MSALRAFFLAHRRLVAILLAATLCLKALIPTGFMPYAAGHALTIKVCADATGGHPTRLLVLREKGRPTFDRHHNVAGACPFAALAHAALGHADPAWRVAPVAVPAPAPVRAAFVPAAPRRYGRPPSRGPPLPA